MTEPLTAADVDRVVSHVVDLMRRRLAAVPGDERRIKAYGDAWLSQHPGASYSELSVAIGQYVQDYVYDGPLGDPWLLFRKPASERLKACKQGYGGRA